MKKHILIIGGTSGLGLELAKQYQEHGHEVTITGRTDPHQTNLHFVKLDISSDSSALTRDMHTLVDSIDPVNTLIYAAGFYQEGYTDEIGQEGILQMINVGTTAPALLVSMLKNGSGKPLKVIFITSSSQYTPRAREPLYTMVKAGLGMFGRSLALDRSLGKIMVVAPSGMLTPFWNNEKDTSTYIEPAWAAQQIIEQSSGPFKYKFVKLLRDPARVLVEEVQK
jgi:NAD(P)-dependent dehydrogenase (short-subunit alcohol dehydrogenase family)